MKNKLKIDFTELNNYISATRLRLRQSSPFFASLSMYAKIEFTNEFAIAATDGEKIFFHPENYINLNPKERDAIFLHELLHMALLHSSRQGERDNYIFNIAADIVVNGMLATEPSVKLPANAIRDEKLESLKVEEIYEILLKKKKKIKLPINDLILKNKKVNSDKYNKELDDLNKQNANKQFWKKAINDSLLIAKQCDQNNIPPSFKRHCDEITKPEVNWKSHLWRFLVRTPNDFEGFDRRFIHNEIYIEELKGETVFIFCCIDTSGSVSPEELEKFLGELTGIVNSYPNLVCKLWYADTDLYGPFDITKENGLPPPEGGGFTSFDPFFEEVEKINTLYKDAVCIYLTDGYAYLPIKKPELPVLWVITPGGQESEYFTFGEVIRLNESNLGSI
tara:strand:+ start:322 stop:1500 length:1179 start_codon:yes stop_codon:yes gene_type:complete